VRNDWLSLLQQGIYRPGTAVSDSHRISVEDAGWARTFVGGVGDDPSTFNVTDFDNQVKAGNMVMSAGPYMTVTARSPMTYSTVGIGGTLSAPDGNVRLRIMVRSPAWIPVEEVRVIGNGFLLAAFDATTTPPVRPVPGNFQSTASTLRFRSTLRLTLTEDTYLIVEAGAKFPSNPTTVPDPAVIAPTANIIVPGVVPEAIANPIFVDVDGVGFQEPGAECVIAGTPCNVDSDCPPTDTCGVLVARCVTGGTPCAADSDCGASDTCQLPVQTVSRSGATRRAGTEVRIVSGSRAGVRGLWGRLRSALARIAARVNREVVAQEPPQPTGEMTGVTKERKDEAAKKGEYFPLYEFSVSPEDVERARRAAEQADGSAAPEGTEQPPGAQ
jgi:hypothetical protein